MKQLSHEPQTPLSVRTRKLPDGVSPQDMGLNPQEIMIDLTIASHESGLTIIPIRLNLFTAQQLSRAFNLALSRLEEINLKRLKSPKNQKGNSDDA